MKIVITEKFRRNFIIVLNLIKNILVVAGLGSTVFFSLGLDSLDVAGNYAAIGAFSSLGVVLLGMALEIFIVMCLLRKNERINTIFRFGFYDLRCEYVYREYMEERRYRNRLKGDYNGD